MKNNIGICLYPLYTICSLLLYGCENPSKIYTKKYNLKAFSACGKYCPQKQIQKFFFSSKKKRVTFMGAYGEKGMNLFMNISINTIPLKYSCSRKWCKLKRELFMFSSCKSQSTGLHICCQARKNLWIFFSSTFPHVFITYKTTIFEIKIHFYDIFNNS